MGKDVPCSSTSDNPAQENPDAAHSRVADELWPGGGTQEGRRDHDHVVQAQVGIPDTR